MQKINNQTHYRSLTQQEPKTSASAVTCSDEIQQKNLKRYSSAPGNIILFEATFSNLQQLYFTCSNFLICSMSLVGHRTVPWLCYASLPSISFITQILRDQVIRSNQSLPVDYKFLVSKEISPCRRRTRDGKRESLGLRVRVIIPCPSTLNEHGIITRVRVGHLLMESSLQSRL